MDMAQLSQGCRATTRRHITFDGGQFTHLINLEKMKGWVDLEMLVFRKC